MSAHQIAASEPGVSPGPRVVTATTSGNRYHAVLAVSYSSPTTTMVLYLDGVSQGTTTTAAANPGITQALDFGRAAAGGEYFNGVLDEQGFVTGAARSANWVATEYANQNNPPSIGAFAALATRSNLSTLGVG